MKKIYEGYLKTEYYICDAAEFSEEKLLAIKTFLNNHGFVDTNAKTFGLDTVGEKELVVSSLLFLDNGHVRVYYNIMYIGASNWGDDCFQIDITLGSNESEGGLLHEVAIYSASLLVGELVSRTEKILMGLTRLGSSQKRDA